MLSIFKMTTFVDFRSVYKPSEFHLNIYKIIILELQVMYLVYAQLSIYAWNLSW